MDESWLLPYSDLLTLLLALFIVLFASSSIDQSKLQKMSETFNAIFSGGSGFMDHTSVLENPTSNMDGMSDAQLAYIKDQQQLKQIQSQLDNLIAVNELENTFETKMTDEGLLLTIGDNILFDSGSATLKSEYTGITQQLASILELNPSRYIVITGHTDNVPFTSTSGGFQSNWDLSVMRAVSLLRSLVESNPNLDPQLFSAKGYGEFNPIASNDTPEGRAQNRRVEVLIQQLVEKEELPNQTQQQE